MFNYNGARVSGEGRVNTALSERGTRRGKLINIAAIIRKT